MQPRGALTSCDTTLQAPPSPGKRRMSVKDMLKIAWQLGQVWVFAMCPRERCGVPPQSIECDKEPSQKKEKKKILTLLGDLWLIYPVFALREPVRGRKSDFRGSVDRGS